MIFICNSANEITPIFSGDLRQGSISANEILLLAPYPQSGTTVTLRVLLPNGILLPADPSKAFVFSPVEFSEEMPLKLDTTALNAWRLRVDAAITEFAGNISFQFAISRLGGDGVPPALFTTTKVVENIPRGVPSLPGDGVDYEPSLLDLYTAAVEALERAEAALEGTEAAAQSASSAAQSASSAAQSASSAAQSASSASIFAINAASSASKAASSAAETEEDRIAINSTVGIIEEIQRGINATYSQVLSQAERVANDKQYVENTVGDMQAAFDELHTYAQTIINGGTAQ